MISVAQFNSVCGKDAYKEYVRKGGVSMAKGLIEMLDDLAISAQVS